MRGILLIAIVMLCGCRSEPPKVLRVRVSADEQFRARPNWKELVAARLAGVNPIFAPMGVRWEMAVTSDWAADPAQPLETLRRELGGYMGQDAIALGIVTGPRGESLGAVVPLDPRLLVVDMPGQPETRNQAILAHHLGRILGAWTSTDASSFMHVPPGEGPDKAAAAVIKLTRGVEFLKGAGGLSKDNTAALDKLWKDSKAPAGSHPLASYWSQLGEELLSKGKARDAIEPLARAVSYQPGDAKIRLTSALALGATNRFPAAAGEFRKASELDPNSVLAFNALGGILANLQKWDESAEAFRKAVALTPKDAKVRANLGMVLINIPSKLNEGIAELRAAQQLDPGNAGVAKALRVATERSAAGSGQAGKSKPLR